MNVRHIAAGEAQMARFVNLEGTAALNGRAQRLDELMTRWRKQVMKRKGLLSTVSILPLAACGGSDPKTLVIRNPDDDISARTDLSGFRLDLHNANTELTMTLEQHNTVSFINTGGTQTVVLTTAGTTSTKSGIENYEILEGTTLTISSSTDGVNVTETGTPSAVSTIDVSGRTLTGNFIDFDTDDILLASQSANISGAAGAAGSDEPVAGSALGFGVLDFADTDGVTLTLTQAQHQSLATVINTGGTQTFEITTAGEITARDGIENYLLSADGNTLTVNTVETGVNITGGAGADTVVVGGLTVTGTFTDIETISATAGVSISGVNGGAATGAGTLNVNDSAGTFTMSAAQHQGLATVSNVTNTQTFVLATAGEITSRSGIENYTLHNDAGNVISVLAGTNVNASAASADVVYVGGLTVTGTYQTGTEDIISATSGANISEAVIGSVDALDINNSAGNFTMTRAQHEQLATVSNTGGIQTFTLMTAGVLTAREGIENYTLHNGSGNVISVLAGTNVNASAASADMINVGGLTVTGTYQTGTEDTISATAGANISGATIGLVDALDIDDSAGTYTMTGEQHEQLATVANTGGVQTFVLTSAGVVTARNGIENYHLADAGGSTFTQSATTTPVTVKSGAGNDLIITNAVDANRSALTVDLTSGGNDTVRIMNDTGSLVVGNNATPTLDGTVATTYGGFGGGVGYNAASFTDTTNAWITAGKPGSSTYVEIEGFTAFATDTGRDIVQLQGYTGAVIEGVNRTTTDLRGVASGSILEINTAESGFTIALNQAGTLSTIANMLRTLSNVEDGEYYVIVYDGSDINANAFLYYARATEGDGFDFADVNGDTGGYDTDSVELMAVFHGVGANAFSSLNFEAVPPSII